MEEKFYFLIVLIQLKMDIYIFCNASTRACSAENLLLQGRRAIYYHPKLQLCNYLHEQHFSWNGQQFMLVRISLIIWLESIQWNLSVNFRTYSEIALSWIKTSQSKIVCSKWLLKLIDPIFDTERYPTLSKLSGVTFYFEIKMINTNIALPEGTICWLML